MGKDEVVCPFGGRTLSRGWRLNRLSSLEEMLSSTYGYFFRQVKQPYSDVEQEIFVRIIQSLSSLLEDDLPRSCSSCKFTKDDFVFGGQVEFFRLELPPKDPFSVSSRFHCLCELEARLNCFFVHEGRDKAYSYKEKDMIRRMKRMFVHELRNTAKYNLFKGTHVRRVSEEEQLELKRQKTDEIRLQKVPICHYNPLSRKFKKMKEEYLKENEIKYGKS